jgi:hypothetical protein
MENTGTDRVNMDTFQIGHAICIAGSFFGWIAIALMVGGEGPDIFVKNNYINPLVEVVPDNPDDQAQVAKAWDDMMDKQDARDEVSRNSGTLIEYMKSDVIVSGLSRKNQVLYVQALVQKPGWGSPVLDGLTETFNLDMAVWHSGYKETLHLVCDMLKDYDTKTKMLKSGHYEQALSHESLQSGFFKVHSSATFLDGFPSTETFTRAHADLFRTAIEKTLGGGIKAGQVKITGIKIPEWKVKTDNFAASVTSVATAALSLFPTPPPTPKATTRHWLVCGAVGGNNEKSCGSSYNSLDNSLHEMRCCADEEPTQPGWLKRDGCTVWAASSVAAEGFDCQHSLNYWDAEAMCKQVGGRLCSAGELEADCTKGSGCGHDSDHVWSTTPGPPRTVPIEVSYAITDLSEANATIVKSIIDEAAGEMATTAGEVDGDDNPGECKKYCKGVEAWFHSELIKENYLTMERQPFPFTLTITSAEVMSQAMSYKQASEYCAHIEETQKEQTQEAEVFKEYTHAGHQQRTVHCPANQEFCDPFTLYFSHYVDHPSYRLAVAFRHPGLLYVKQVSVRDSGSMGPDTYLPGAAIDPTRNTCDLLSSHHRHM